MDLSRMTKQELVDYGNTIGVTLEYRLNKATMIERLNTSQVIIEEKIKNDAMEMLEKMLAERDANREV
jgi:hypothetical protein